MDNINLKELKKDDAVCSPTCIKSYYDNGDFVVSFGNFVEEGAIEILSEAHFTRDAFVALIESLLTTGIEYYVKTDDNIFTNLLSDKRKRGGVDNGGMDSDE